MNRHLLLASLLFLVAAITAGARTLSPEEAIARVAAQLNSENTASTASLSSISRSLVTTDPVLRHTASTPAGEAAVYVFTPSEGDGYMCVAANDVAPRALLGYSTEGDFDADNIPLPMRGWLESYSGEIAAAEAGGIIDATEYVDSRSDVEPILPTRWGQLSPFNDLTPEINGHKAPCGCVATALAQCMYVEKWPSKGTGDISYDWWVDGKSQKLTADLDTFSFDWDQIIDFYGEGTGGTAQQRYEVAKLLYAVGLSVHMQYNLQGSGSSYVIGAQALIRNFDYAASVCYYERDYFGLEKWMDRIYEQLADGLPVPYAGQSSEGGHAFVCDGYRQGGYFHFNWGWYGSQNGYFLLSALNPGAMARVYEQGYNTSQNIITGLVRASKYVEPAVALRVSGDFQTTSDNYLRSAGGTVTFKAQYGFFARSFAKAVVTLGIKMIDEAGNVSYAAAPTKTTFELMSAVPSYAVSMSQLPMEGTYTVSPAYMDSIGQWHDISSKLSEVGSLSMTTSSSKILFGDSSLDPELSFTDMHLGSPLHIDGQFNFLATITNEGTEFYDDIYVALADADSTLIAIGPARQIDIPSGETITAEWIGTLNRMAGKTLTSGNFKMGLVSIVDLKYKIMSPLIDVTLQGQSTVPVIFTAGPILIDGAATTYENPAVISSSPTTVSVKLDCTQGYFSDRISIQVLGLDTNVAHLETGSRFAGLDEGTSATLSYSTDLSSLESGVIYRVLPYGVSNTLLDTEPAYIRIGESSIDGIEADAVSICPNPAAATTVVRAPATIDGVDVYSVSGMRQSVEPVTDGNAATLDVSALAPGIYIVRIQLPDSVRTVRLIKR